MEVESKPNVVATGERAKSSPAAATADTASSSNHDSNGAAGQRAASASTSASPQHAISPSKDNEVSTTAQPSGPSPSASGDHPNAGSSNHVADNSASANPGASASSSQNQASTSTAAQSATTLTPATASMNVDMIDFDGSISGSESAKRPRLRLAHACDRCRRRKIRCDTQHPCTPCQQSNNQCTFETPSRRTVKPKNASSSGSGAGVTGTGSGSGSGQGLGQSSSSSGIKRPHSPLRNSLAGLTAAPGESQANLEARLAALESMLRDVPPNVHNAFLSTLDARLGSGTGVGIKEGEGIGVAVEAFASSGTTANNNNISFGASSAGTFPGTSSSGGLGDLGWNLSDPSSATLTSGLNSSSFGNPTLTADWTHPNNPSALTGNNNQGNNATAGRSGGNDSSPGNLSSWLASIGAGVGIGGGLTKRREEVGMDELAKRMEGMSFFYEDEIGQAKWQGATSGFPLLHLLTAANAPQESDETAIDSDVIASPQGSALSTSPAGVSLPSVPRRVSSASTALHIGAGNSAKAASGSGVRASSVPRKTGRSSSLGVGGRNSSPGARKKERFFPDRTPRPHQTLNPEASWKVITGVIPPDLMDTLVRCYLSTSHLLWPFLHVPSFLADYANPQQWGEPGFTCFIVAVCTLSSRHVDDPRVRANPNDPSTAGKQYFELFKRLRDLPSADRPTLYSIQAAFLAAVYAFGLGNLSKAFALQAESITLCLDGGLHRSVDGYDHFDAIEKETRKRTFWSIYSWDKQSAALFGRPPIIHLRDCDVTEPLIVDDENLGPEGVKDESIDAQSRIGAFVAAIRLHVILEGVIDSATRPSSFPTSPFLARAAATIARRSPQNESLQDELSLLEEWTRILPKYWHYDAETAASRDPIRITQAERLHCLEHLVKMIIYRHRFSGFVAMPASTAEERARHLDLCRKAMQCALTIIADHVHISQRGMMTYYGVHVIHQLAQAGRTLVAVILNCRDADFRPIIAPSIEGLRSCVGLLRRFSGRYLCGLRSADIIDEFCRICNIPVNSPRVPDSTSRPSPAWLRPVPKRVPPTSGTGFNGSPGTMMDFNASTAVLPGQGIDHVPNPNDLDALFNTSAYFDMSAIEAGTTAPATGLTQSGPTNTGMGGHAGNLVGASGGLGEPSAPFDKLETLTPNHNLGNGNIMLSQSQSQSQASHHNNNSNNIDHNQNNVGLNGPYGGGIDHTNQNQNQNQNIGSGGVMGLGTMSFDYGLNGNGFGGESLAMEGMDTVSDGLKGNGAGGGLSAATILSLMEEGSFDYGSIFTDQAPLPMDVE
ncbi:nuclear protein [Kwoniella heveanensis CBS 569]|nr:nuclear protein [Kwoniella heveanensis CBS 569]